MAYKRILAPVDGSRVSTRGLNEAIRLARLAGARIRLLHVIDEMVWTDAIDAGAATATLIDSMRDSGKRTIRNALAVTERHHVKADTLLIEEFGMRVADVIPKEARTWRAMVWVNRSSSRAI